MKTKMIFIFVVVFALSSCSRWSSKRRTPAEAGSGLVDLLDLSQSLIDKVATREINPQSCAEELEVFIKDYAAAPALVDLNEIKSRGQEIINQNFEARLSIHSMLSILPKECKILVKDLFLKMRMTEDYVGVHFYNDPQVTAESISYTKEPVPVYEPEKYHPFHVGKGIDPKKKFEFKNGDIIITKGVSFISSTISELATPKSIFSHIVFVHVDGKNVPTTIESYVGRGVSVFSMEDALKNENSRILVLRAKDSVMAGKAADHMLSRVEKLKEKKKVIPYDYNLDFTDNSKLSCEEVAYDGFKTVSDSKIIIPEVESQVLLDDAKFLKRIGVKKGPMMVPSDMETDSRFEIVLDWTDYRVLRDSWRKDAILGEMFRWIQEYDYRIHENLTSIAAKVVWSSRYTPVVWPLLSRAAGIPTDFMKDIPNLTVSTMASLRGIGAEMLPVLVKADEDAFKKTGRWLTTEELRKALDDFRQTKPKKLRKVFRER